MDIREAYKQRIKKYSLLSENLHKKQKRISLFRLVFFLLAIISLYVTSRYNFLPAIGLFVLFTGIFIFLVKKHADVIKSKNHNDHLLDINKTEIDILNGNYKNRDPGNEYIDPVHPFISDLDIFGEGSLFQYINRTATVLGKSFLARVFLSPFTHKNDIKRIHNCINELKEQTNWRQQFLATGYTLKDKKEDRDQLFEWLNEKPLFEARIFNLITVLIPLLTIGMFILTLMSIITVNTFVVYGVLPASITVFHLRTLNSQHNKLSRRSETLRKYAGLLSQIENQSFKSKALQQIRKQLFVDTQGAGSHIKKLAKILAAFDNRLNMLAGVILNFFFLWDIIQVRRTEKWKKAYGKQVANWFEVIAQTDALISMSSFWYNHPDYILPEIIDDNFFIKAKNTCHPLIDKDEMVVNDIEIREKSHFTIITGANMAGKSTYLRTIGTGLIMARCGLPVCASEFTFMPVELYTSMRTRDSLVKKESYFQAELNRLKIIIDVVERNQNALILLDEILKGTNSKDKQAGSKALVSQFIKFRGSGVIATHDLALGELEKEYPDNVSNYCFEVEIKNNELYFDYKLKPGISQKMNATFLMKQMGITM